MKGDLIIKGVDLEQLEEDLGYLDDIYEEFNLGKSTYDAIIDESGKRVLGMLKTWAEGRKAERGDEELARKLIDEAFAGGTNYAKDIYGRGVLAGLKAQRKRLGK